MDAGKEAAARIVAAVEQRFDERIEPDAELPGAGQIARMLEHCSHRKWTERAVDANLLRLLCAAALAAPSKSDLQQTDIIEVADSGKRQAIVATIDDMDWIMQAPVFLVFCGNNRRLRLIAQREGAPFPNKHLDQFFNAACDAAIIMASFVHAAEAVGLGCCPISHVRNRADKVSEVLGLPQWVFPFAGLCVGYPARGNRITPRLPLGVTLHTDRYDESQLEAQLAHYDARRNALQPYARQRDAKRFGQAERYGWSTDKARQYAVMERERFGAFVRSQGFELD
jgi:nitroreductase/FMN reductase [NAD(P)H]